MQFFQSTLIQKILTPPAAGATPALIGYSNPTPSSYSGPITISQAGIYKGNWESTNGATPAVTITTPDPVIIINSNIKGAGYLIHASGTTPNVRIYNTRGYGGTPSSTPRRFFICGAFRNVTIEHCYLESTAGILLAGDYMGNETENETFRIRYNDVLNIDGRLAAGYATVQFVQTNTVRQNEISVNNGVNYYDGVPYAQITWNYIKNEAGKSHVEDVINLYKTRGVNYSPILVQHNYVNGSYYWDWQGENFTGSGMIADSPGSDKGSCSAYIDFWDNVVIGSNNNDYGVAGGNNIRFRRNVGLNKGYLNEADATRLGLTPASAQCEYIGYPGNIYVHEDNLPAGTTHTIEETDHTEGIHGERTFSAGNPRWRNDGDLWSATFGTITNRTTLAGNITETTENTYTTNYLNNRTANNVVVGIQQNNIHYSRTFDSTAYLNDFAFTKETSTAYGITLLNDQLRFELRNTDAATNGGVRAEIAYGSMPQAEMWFRFDATLPSADNAVDPNPESIMQFRPIADASETDERGTVMALQVENGNYRFYTAYATLATNTAAEGFTFYELGAVTYDTPTKWVIRYRPAFDSSGILELYKNGVLVVNHPGPNKYNDAQQPFWKVGLYKWNWPATTVTTKRVLLIDNIRQGDSTTTLAQINA